MRRKVVTIRDVAERAGVSVSTVSHVLNGNDQHVGEQTRLQVLDAVSALRYRPNAIARSMVKQQTATIGMVLSEIDNPLFMPVVAGVEDLLRPMGYHIVLASAPDVVAEVQAIETLRSQQVDGFIFMSLSTCLPNDHLIHLNDDGIPLVVINRCMDLASINQVSWADREAARSATCHLLNLGHTRIGTICGPIHAMLVRKSAIERHEGWLQALAEHQVSAVSDWIVDGNYTYEGGYAAAQQFVTCLQQGREIPSALFVASDVMAVGALKALHSANIRVPEEIAVITTGNPPFAAYTVPALTTLSHPTHEAGQVAARMLLDCLSAASPPQARHVTLNFKLTVRESCGASTNPDFRMSSLTF